MLNFQDMADALLSKGIDQSSTVDKIPEGFCEDIVNCDIVGTSLAKRKGFERFAGDVPLRVESIEVTNNGSTDSAVFNLPTYVDLTEATVGPLWIQGSFLDSGGVTRTLDLRVPSYGKADLFTLLSANTTQTVLPAASGITSVNCLIGLQSVADTSVFMTDEVWLHASNNNVEIKYSTATDIDTYIYTYSPAAADMYWNGTVDLASSTSLSIDFSVHGLPNSNIIPVCYFEEAGYLKTWLPDNLELDANGSVLLEYTDPLDAFNSNIFLTSAPLDNIVAGSTSSLDSSTVVNIPDAESKHIFAAVYRRAISTSTRQLLIPESIVYVSSTNSHDITLLNSEEAFAYEIYYVYGLNVTNRITIDNIGAVVTSSVTTSLCNLSVSGINQDELPVKSVVNYIDSYLQSDESIIAVDGQLYRSSDVSLVDQVSGSNILSSDVIIGPTFKAVAPVPGYRRSQGYIVTTAISGLGYATVTEIYYLPASGYTRYILNTPAYQAYDSTGTPTSLSSVVSTNRDKLTVTRCNNSKFNGTFDIKAVGAVDSNTLAIDVSNVSIDKSIWDTADIDALAGIFTDEIAFSGAIIASEGGILEISSSLSVTVSEILTATQLYISEVTDTVQLPQSLRLGVTASIEELTYATANLVIGDIVTCGDRTTRIEDLTGGVITFREAINISNGRVDIVIPYRWELIVPTTLGDDIVSRTDILRSVSSKGSLYLSSGIKYDGDKTYQIGFPNFQANLFLQVELGSGIAINVPQAEIDSIAESGSDITLATHALASNFPIGSQIIRKHVDAGATFVTPYDVFTVEDSDATGGVLRVNGTMTEIGTSYVSKFVTLDYFIRLSTLDRNGNLVVSNSAGSGDMRCLLPESGKVHIRGTVLGADVENIDRSLTNIEIFRRWDGGNYRKIGVLPLDNLDGTYFTFTDTVPFASTSERDIDQVPDTLGGIGETRSGPLSAQVTTSINNQLVMANLTGEPKVRLTLTGDATEAAIDGSTWEVDVGGAATVFEVFKAADEITPIAWTGTVGTSFTVEVAHAAGVAAGDILYIFRDDPLRADVSSMFLGWWTVNKVTAGATDLVEVLWSDAVATGTLTAADTDSLMILKGHGVVPLHSEVINYNCGQAIYEVGETPSDRFPYHLASAINSMLSSQGIYARAGRDKSRGFLEIYGDDLVSVTLPATIPTGMDIFANGALASGGDEILKVSYGYPARVTLSVPLYPEVFEDVEADASTNLPLVQDFNPDDGEEVVAAVPFFSESAFGAAQRSNALVVFKAHSIYLLDPQAKLSGSSDFAKQIDSKGLGCEAPGSIVASSGGIFFANSSGIYFLDRSLNIIYIGNNVSGMWDSSLLDKPNVDRACACNDRLEQRYMLSIPTQEDEEYTAGVLLYDLPDNSQEATGGWTRYTNFHATCWANRGISTLFSTDRGYVGILRREGELTDYSDAGESIDVEITFRAQSFGLPTTRKVLRYISLMLSSELDREEGEVALELSTDFYEDFNELDEYTLTGKSSGLITGISDLARRKLDSVAFSPDISHATWYQCKLLNGTDGFERDLIIHNIIYTVASVRTRGVQQAKQSARVELDNV